MVIDDIESIEQVLVQEETEYHSRQDCLNKMRKKWESMVEKNYSWLRKIQRRQTKPFDIDRLDWYSYRRSLNLYYGVSKVLVDDSKLEAQIQSLEREQSESIQRKVDRLQKLAILYGNKNDHKQSIDYYKSAFHHMEKYQEDLNDRFKLILPTAFQHICLGVEYFPIAKELLKEYILSYHESKSSSGIPEEDMKEAVRLINMIARS